MRRIGVLGDRKARWRDRWNALGGTTVTSIIVFFVMWEVVVDLTHVPRYILPPPSAVYRQLARNLPVIWKHTRATGEEAVVGYAIAVGISVPLAMLVAFSTFLQRTFYQFALALEMVPKIAFAPVLVVWFGFGFMPKMLVVFMVCFFPILLNGIHAFRSLSPELVSFSRSTGAHPLTVFRRVRFPAALPQIFISLKGAATAAIVGAIISEWIGGDSGLGYYLQVANGDLKTDLSLAIIMVLAALGLIFFGLVTLAERKLIPWHVSQRMGGRTP